MPEPTPPDPLVRRLKPWQALLLDAIDDFLFHRGSKPWTIVLAGDSLGHVSVIEGRPRLAKIKLEPLPN